MRVPESYLFGLKKLLVGWGFVESGVRVDMEEWFLKVGGELVVSVSVGGCGWRGMVYGRCGQNYMI